MTPAIEAKRVVLLNTSTHQMEESLRAQSWLARVPLHKKLQRISSKTPTVFGSFRYLSLGTVVERGGKQAKHILTSSEYKCNLFGPNLWQELMLFLAVLLRVNVCLFLIPCYPYVFPFKIITDSMSENLLAINNFDFFMINKNRMDESISRKSS